MCVTMWKWNPLWYFQNLWACLYPNSIPLLNFYWFKIVTNEATNTSILSYQCVASWFQKCWRIKSVFQTKYEWDSVNRSQIDIKRKTCVFRTRNKTCISRHILHQHRYTCPIAWPVRRKPQNTSILTVVSAISAPGRASSENFERPPKNFSTQSWAALRDKHIPP
jgi:hypothetical protein